MKNLLAIACVLVLTVFGCQPKVLQSAFVTTDGAQFVKEGKPYYFVGTNYWYGGILGSVGQGGDRVRLIKELDMMQEHGIDNLRILAGAEGPNNEPFRVTPALQMAPGVYNDTILDGLDFLLNEMGKRKMSAVLFLNNTWEWSGGYAQYLNWAGFGAIPYPQIAPHSWPEFMAFSSQFHSSEGCMQMYRDHIKFMLSRTNRYSGLKYTQDPAIMTWEIANEPRALSVENKANFSKWIEETADYIKSLDANHLVTTGTEGLHGCEEDMALFETIHSNVSVDYLTMHIWPNNWGWIDNERIMETLDSAISLSKAYMTAHIAVAQKLNKPIVFEEFGLPRDNHLFSLDDPTTARDKYYAYAFAMVEKSAMDNGVLAGSNFWAFGGTGRHWRDDPYWQAGDDLMGDPPQEEQGLNSVFDTDSTMGLIKEHSLALKKAIN